MIDKFYLFSDLNRDGNTIPLEDVYEHWSGPMTKIISMSDEEDAYLFSMQLMLGTMNIIPFQKFHDDFWVDRRKEDVLIDYMRGHIFSTDPNLLDYMSSYRGDLDKDARHKQKKHWSKLDRQTTLNDRFFI